MDKAHKLAGALMAAAHAPPKVVELARLIDEYHGSARRMGFTDEQAKATLDEQIRITQASWDLTTSDAVRAAHSLLVRAMLGNS